MRVLLLLLCVSISAGCAWLVGATREPTRAVGSFLLSDEEERRLGLQVAEQVEQQETLLDDPVVVDCVGRIAQSLLDVVPEGERRFDYRFAVIDGLETVNAFALPGGFIYVFSGLIRSAGNEAELAGVLAHEIAHVTQGHISDQLAAQVGLETLHALALGSNPGLVAQLAAGVAAQGYLAAYSREAEREADEVGLRMMSDAGYDPRGLAAFFERLERMRGTAPGRVQAFFATHPEPGQRAGRVVEIAQAEDRLTGATQVVGCFDDARARLGE